jgi:sec-independent protein translocase protein TatB
MLDVGFSEILLTSAIALIVLGPERLPKVARQVGNWMGRARAMARQLSEQLEREVSAEELLKAQSKTTSGAAPLDTNSLAAPPAAASPPALVPPAAAAAAPDQVYGVDAAFTTPQAMHAPDPPAAVPETAAADTKPAHE